MRMIDVGVNIHTGKPQMWSELDQFGIHIIGAKTRYGKSQLMKSIIVNVAETRRILIMDYAGEHTSLMYPNFFGANKYIRSIPDLVVIDNLGFLISDFDRYLDWLSLGFPEGASNLLAMLSKHKEVHGDEPILFYKLLMSLPITNEEVGEFMSRFPTLGIDNKINSATKDSAVTRFRYILNRGLFCTVDDIQSGYKTYITDFVNFMKENRYVLINFGLSGSSDAFIGRAYVGKILERLASPPERLKNLHLAIFCEEADVLFPNSSDYEMSSNYWIMLYSLKFQKYWIELFFVVQDLNNLQQDIVKSYHSMILGIVPMYGIVYEYKDIINKLKWDYIRNYRQFVIIEVGDLEKSKKNVFEPYMTPCLS